jgi:hypothetical protein
MYSFLRCTWSWISNLYTQIRHDKSVFSLLGAFLSFTPGEIFSCYGGLCGIELAKVFHRLFRPWFSVVLQCDIYIRDIVYIFIRIVTAVATWPTCYAKIQCYYTNSVPHVYCYYISLSRSQWVLYPIPCMCIYTLQNYGDCCGWKETAATFTAVNTAAVTIKNVSVYGVKG